MVSGVNITLPGVLLYEAFTQTVISQNISDVTLSYVFDGSAELSTHLLFVGLPMLAVICLGLIFVSYYTDEDGFVRGARRILSDPEHTLHMYFYIFCIYAFEGTQYAALAFAPSTVKGLSFGEDLMKVMTGFLLNGSNWFAVFPTVVVLQILMLMFMVVPMIAYYTMTRANYQVFADSYVHGNFSKYIALAQDSFLYFWQIPFFISLLIFIPCEYFETGEPALANFRTTECNSSTHKLYGTLGGVIALASLLIGILAGTVPACVERHTDLAINGRHTAISFMVRAGLACNWILNFRDHEWILLIVCGVGQLWLLYLNVSLRPCLVERVNFHRSAVICMSFIPTISLIIASGLDDSRNQLPVAAGGAMAFLMFLMLMLKYYVFPSGKLFPAMPYAGGEYEGGLILGLSLPQGHGVLRWPDQNKVWGGTFFFGRYHGYGVMTQYKAFFQGMHRGGHREGFGVTNKLEVEDEDFYEGNWKQSLFSGPGTKQYKNNDTYDGEYLQGLEHGKAVWSFDTALGRHSISAKFKNGQIEGFKFLKNEKYEGDMRFGCPHGTGTLVFDNNTFQGEFRAGKLHGNGSFVLANGAGRYDGLFLEGRFHEDGVWKDDTETYSGKWVQGEKHGLGVQELESGTYEGMFVHDVRMGFGTFTYKNGTVYTGSWYNNIYHGNGTLRSGDGAEYEGFWAHGKRHGPRGRVRYPTGEEYNGDWDEDEYHGEGVLKIPQMGEYHGRFEYSRRHGNGRMTFFDGSEYIGDWFDDLPGGFGKFVFSSRKAIMVLKIMSLEDASRLEVTGPKNILDFGGVYEGEFVDGTMNGQGAVKTGDGTLYEGEWAEGFPEGVGKMGKSNGTFYEGEFSSGNPHGKGKMQYPDDRIYDGDFHEGKRHGHGVLYDAQGEVVYDCEWINDIPEHMQGVKDAVEDFGEAPTVDIDDLLRVIMPSSQTPTDIEQTAFRRRLELEERAMRFGVCLVVDEERLWRHNVRNYLGPLETFFRRKLEDQYQIDTKNEAKSSLAHILNQWKADFRKRESREPKKSDLLKDNTISGAYTLYMNLSGAK
jgi:hypothetical protein